MNKGFTLIELVAAIVIISLIAVLAFPPILNMLNKGEKDVSEAVQKTLVSSAEEYVLDHLNDFIKPLEEESDKAYEIDIDKLVREGYVNHDFYKKYCAIHNDSITVIAHLDKYEYQYNNKEDNCSE